MSKLSAQAKYLLAQREMLTSGLPAFAQIVRGSLVTRYRRWGKPTCHCVKSRGHGPAHYRVVTLKPGKTEQILLSEEMLPGARQFLDNCKQGWAALEKVSAVNRRLLRLRVGGLAAARPSPHRPGVEGGRGAAGRVGQVI